MFICQARESTHSSVTRHLINPVRHDLMTQHKTASYSIPLRWLENTQTLVALPCCPGNEFASSCIMRASMGAIWLHQGWCDRRQGRLEGGNARFNEMWVSAAHLHSSDLCRWLTGAWRGTMWKTHSRRASNWLTSPATLWKERNPDWQKKTYFSIFPNNIYMTVKKTKLLL